MNSASLISVILAIISMLGVVGVAVFNFRSSTRSSELSYKGDRLDLAWQMQEKQITRLETNIADLMARATNAEARANQLDIELQECKAGRHGLELQVEVLRMRLGDANTP